MPWAIPPRKYQTRLQRNNLRRRLLSRRLSKLYVHCFLYLFPCLPLIPQQGSMGLLAGHDPYLWLYQAQRCVFLSAHLCDLCQWETLVIRRRHYSHNRSHFSLDVCILLVQYLSVWISLCVGLGPVGRYEQVRVASSGTGRAYDNGSSD